MCERAHHIFQVTGSSGLTGRMVPFNSVSLEFVPTSALILTDISMLVQNSPGSLCHEETDLLILICSDF